MFDQNAMDKLWLKDYRTIQMLIIYNYRQFSNISHTLTGNKISRHLSRQWNLWSLRCSWSIACRRCSNYIFILDLTPGFNILHKKNYKTMGQALQFCDLVRLY